MKYLIVVDMQKDFIDGTLGTTEAQAIVPAVAEKLRARRSDGWTVLYTRDTHGPDYLQTQEGNLLPVMHCIRDTEGWQIAAQLAPQPQDTVLDKPCFGSLALPSCLQQPEEIEIVGLCTDICVISNALILKAAFPEVPLCVDAKCCAGVTPESHGRALKAMQMCQIRIEGSDE